MKRLETLVLMMIFEGVNGNLSITLKSLIVLRWIDDKGYITFSLPKARLTKRKVRAMRQRMNQLSGLVLVFI